MIFNIRTMPMLLAILATNAFFVVGHYPPLHCYEALVNLLLSFGALVNSEVIILYKKLAILSISLDMATLQQGQHSC